MAAKPSDDLKKCYEKYARQPKYVTGFIGPRAENGVFQFYAVSSQKDVQRMATRKALQSFVWANGSAISFPFPSDIEGVSNFTFDATGTKLAIARSVSKDGKTPPEQFIEIWEGGRVQKVIKATGKHGAVYDLENNFSGMGWSEDGKRLLYAAEECQSEPAGFFDNSSKPDATPGLKFVRRENWGEALTSSISPIIVILDVETEQFSFPMDKVEPKRAWGQPVWAPHDEGIVCAGWVLDSRKLGLKFCLNRESAVFFVSLNDDTVHMLSNPNTASRSPQFNHVGTTLIWLENVVGGPHASPSRLMKLEWTAELDDVTPVVVIDVVQDDQSVGIYGERLGPTCFVDDTTLLLTTYHRSSRVVVHVDVASCVMAPVQHTGIPDIEQGVCDLLNASPFAVLANVSSLSKPSVLFLGLVDGTTIHWTPITKSEPLPGLQSRVLTFTAETSWEALVLEKQDEFVAKGARPLLAVPHGGPHSAFASEYFPVLAAFAEQGYVVLLINYRGSLSFGQRCVDSLPGRVGDLDVADVDAAVSRVLESSLADPMRVCVYGGSHGGLLGAHLTAQFPQRYKAAILRNPVIDIPSMAAVTDIPDWCYVEAGLPYGPPDRALPLSPESFAAMQKASPIAHVDGVRAPTLLLLGGQDLRVPPSQGVLWHNAIKARGVTTRVLWFPEEGHGLASIGCEAESFVHAALWLKQYVP